MQKTTSIASFFLQYLTKIFISLISLSRYCSDIIITSFSLLSPSPADVLNCWLDSIESLKHDGYTYAYAATLISLRPVLGVIMKD